MRATHLPILLKSVKSAEFVNDVSTRCNSSKSCRDVKDFQFILFEYHLHKDDMSEILVY